METYSTETVYQGNESMLIAFMAFFFIFALILTVFMIITFWKIFRKAGYEGWEAIIPIYSTYILLKIVGKPGWWLLLMLIPLVNLVFLIWTFNMLSKSFGKDEGFTVGILFLGIVFLPILAFGKSRYLGPYGDPEGFQVHQSRQRFDVEDGLR
jgi:magnesium-transporting ATPase (P-type)